MVKFKLAELLEQKKITRYRLCKDTGIDTNNIKKICDNNSKQIKLDTINTICNYLNCELTDLIEYTKDNQESK